ncbi:hypothetical protein IJ750_03015 [bacterium]|nr:hypothetical protein [bacterium]
MRIIATLLLISMFQNVVFANNFYQSINPFPEQTCPQELNNLYEANPSAIEKEQKSLKKWFRKGHNTYTETETKNQKPGFKTTNEGIILDGTFVVVPNEAK